MDQPLSSSEQTKVVLFLLLLLPTFGLVVVGFLSIFYGMYMTKKQKDFSYIDIARKLFLACTKILFTASLLIGLIISYSEFSNTRNYVNENNKEITEYLTAFETHKKQDFSSEQAYSEWLERIEDAIILSNNNIAKAYSEFTIEVLLPYLIITCIPIVYLRTFDKLFYIPLSNHKDWVVFNGIFSTSTAEKNARVKTAEIIASICGLVLFTVIGFYTLPYILAFSMLMVQVAVVFALLSVVWKVIRG